MSDDNSTPRQGSAERDVPADRAAAETTAETNAETNDRGDDRGDDRGNDRGDDRGNDETAEQAGEQAQTTEVTSEDTRTIERASGEVATEPERMADETLTIEQPPPVEARHPAPTPSVAPSAVTSTVAAPQGGLVTVRTGPRPGAILLGLLCLMVSTYTIVRQTTELRLDFSLAGPVSIGALGTMLLLIGLVGLAGRRRS